MRSILISLLLLLSACTGQQATQPLAEPDPATSAKRFTGTVQYVELEGGFYGIVTDSGHKLFPENLPESFAVNGQEVEGLFQPVRDRMDIRMWGEPVNLLIIAPAGWSECSPR